MKKPITNMAASVHARLLKRAKAEHRPFNELLQYYVMERFLYRLSQSSHADAFVLKGALMLQLWGGPINRMTKDIDLLGKNTSSVENLVDIVRDCVAVEVSDDGLIFDPNTITGEEIRIDAKYNGVRVRCRAHLGNARISLQVDVGFGDVVTPDAQSVEYPTLLGTKPPKLLGYTKETIIAEKCEAMVVLDMANTRMKDFLDIWALANGGSFSGSLLAEALSATFQRRGTALPDSLPIALTPAFYSLPAKHSQWRAYVRKAYVKGNVQEFDSVVTQIRNFLWPVMDAIHKETTFSAHWPVGGPWQGGNHE